MSLDSELAARLALFVKSEGADFRSWSPSENTPLSFDIPDEQKTFQASEEESPLASLRSRNCFPPHSRPLGAIAGMVSLPSFLRDSLRDMLNKQEESFTDMLLRLIRESDMDNAECYKRAHVDRKLFSKIQKNHDYRPSKQTALSFAVALELPLDTTEELLGKAGYTLSHSQRGDLIVEYFIKSECYDLMLINEALASYDQPLLNV